MAENLRLQISEVLQLVKEESFFAYANYFRKLQKYVIY